MRLICFSPRYYPAVGGAESYVIAMAERFAAAGHTVTVITSDALDFQLFWDPSAKRVGQHNEPTSHNGVNIIRLTTQHLPFVPISYHAWRRGLWCLSHLPFVPQTWVGRLARQTPKVPGLWHLDNLEADAVLGFNICYEPFLWAAKRLADHLTVPFIAVPFTHLGAGEAPGQDVQSSFYTMRHQVAIVNQADIALMQTRCEKEFYTAEGASAEHIRVASAGINPASYGAGDGQRWRSAHNIPADRPIVAFIGTHDFDKGTTHLIEAAEQLWGQNLEFELVLAGSRTAGFEQYYESISAETKQLTHLLGRISDSDKQDLLAALDLFVMASRVDSFGIVFLEAWLYGKPVIGSTAWGMSDVIDENQDGLLVPFGEVNALADAISSLLADPERRQQMGDHGRAKTLAQHPWQQKYETVSNILTDLVQRSSASRSEAAG